MCTESHSYKLLNLPTGKVADDFGPTTPWSYVYICLLRLGISNLSWKQLPYRTVVIYHHSMQQCTPPIDLPMNGHSMGTH